MPSALSVDLRQRVVHAVEAGASRHQAAERFGVSLASASRWCGQFARERHVAPKPMGGDQRSRQIEVMDNLPAHKVSGIRERIEATGAKLLYLPAYSPDLNPIELAFAKLKALLRSAAARTIPDLWNAIGRSLNRFAPDECRAYLAAAGYDAT